LTALRRGLAVVLGLVLVVLTVAFVLRWVDIATREVAAVQAAVPITGTGVVVVTAIALVCRLPRLVLAGAVPSVVAIIIAVASFGLSASPSAGDAETVTVFSSNLEFGGANADDVMKGSVTTGPTLLFSSSSPPSRCPGSGRPASRRTCRMRWAIPNREPVAP
jgi:hypothetical protein